MSARPNGSMPSIRCSCCTPRAPPASPRVCSTAPAATCCTRQLTSKWTFDLKPDDVFWCTADIGWITGHTYVAYGPLALGSTQVVFEGVPTYPDAARFWRMIQAHKVTIFYTAPTAIRALIKAAESDAAVHPRNFDLSSLRLLGTVGEPINPAAWEWYHREDRWRPLPHRRHLLADRNRWPHDHAAAGRPRADAGLLHACLSLASTPPWWTKPARKCRGGRAACWWCASPGRP
jgi:hypothetical protein